MCALNFPTSLNAGLARILGKMLKLDSQHAGLAGIPEIERNKQQYFRQVFCMCNEYQTLATVQSGHGRRCFSSTLALAVAPQKRVCLVQVLGIVGGAAHPFSIPHPPAIFQPPCRAELNCRHAKARCRSSYPRNPTSKIAPTPPR